MQCGEEFMLPAFLHRPAVEQAISGAIRSLIF
jgi:hypothetical protein